MINESDQPLTIQQRIQLELQQLKSDMAFDFVAVALADANYRDIYWKIALGAKSERYKKITVRMGNGMAGKVLQARRPHVVTSFPEEVQDEVLEYPIFLVESLRSGMGVSVDSARVEQKQSYGVLLVGQREERAFGEQEIGHVERTAAKLAVLYDSITIHPVSEDTQGAVQHDKTTPLLQRLRDFRAKGIICELLDQRITQLSHERQEQIAAILELLVRPCIQANTLAKIVLGQDDAGHTLVEYECEGECHLSREMFNPVKDQLIALKCDLEIMMDERRQSVRFTVPTRLLLDEMNWN
ncbi:hypothetical protein [Paenibacillus sp. UMB4589-SE434]|uniref:hypothetical protein n=1 Tax=Paenibacillus sp. UMB4589-SE434 TaxID=3046314 RepID=UPI00254D79B4|nr:hypothetical protein [Paenibacillus sp. UMB4589-SE434]MDK8180217.1 hypothetical protein [Paenibacillus sp. UMB4589-SE434]